MRDAELRAWSDDAALAFTILVRVGSGDIPSSRSSGMPHMASSPPPDLCASNNASLLPLVGHRDSVKTDGDPSRRGGGPGSKKGDLRQVPVELGTP